MIGSAKSIADWIKNNDYIAVCVHFRPDGDAYGTALSLCEAIRSLGKKAFPACDDPVAEKYRFMPGWQEFSTISNMPFTPKAVLAADVSEAPRLGHLAELFNSAESKCVLDHHATNIGFAPACYVDPTAAAAGELALEVIDELGAALTPSMALNIYVAISTDCGNFSFENTKGRTYRNAARCADAGVNVEEATRLLYRLRSFAKTRLLGDALTNIELYENGRVAGVRITKQMIEAAGATSADTHSIVNYLNEIDGVYIGFICEEQDSCAKLSFRASMGANVAALAQEFGGGGHIAAAGANVYNDDFNSVYFRAVEAASRHARLCK